MLIVCLPKLSRLGSVFHLTDFRRGGCYGGGESESVDMMQGVYYLLKWEVQIRRVLYFSLIHSGWTLS
jgi:hypothetical protein